jgi:hypothetical protein
VTTININNGGHGNLTKPYIPINGDRVINAHQDQITHRRSGKGWLSSWMQSSLF